MGDSYFVFFCFVLRIPFHKSADLSICARIFFVRVRTLWSKS